MHLIFFERIRITILDLEPNPCFQTFLIISETYHRIFNCNTSKHRSGQELPFRILRNLLLFFEFRYYPFYYYYSVLSESTFARKNLRNRIAFSHESSHTCSPLPLIVHTIFFERIRITILDLEPNPCFQTFLIISKTYHQIFNCNTSQRRSGQELPFIFFEPRAPTCLWGRYDPKTENFTLFYIYLLHIHSFSKTFYILV